MFRQDCEVSQLWLPTYKIDPLMLAMATYSLPLLLSRKALENQQAGWNPHSALFRHAKKRFISNKNPSRGEEQRRVRRNESRMDGFEGVGGGGLGMLGGALKVHDVQLGFGECSLTQF